MGSGGGGGSCGGAFFAVDDVVDVDADGFEFFSEDVADAVFTGNVGGDVGGVF